MLRHWLTVIFYFVLAFRQGDDTLLFIPIFREGDDIFAIFRYKGGFIVAVNTLYQVEFLERFAEELRARCDEVPMDVEGLDCRTNANTDLHNWAR
jgi:hypothetical protein